MRSRTAGEDGTPDYGTGGGVLSVPASQRSTSLRHLAAERCLHLRIGTQLPGSALAFLIVCIEPPRIDVGARPNQQRYGVMIRATLQSAPGVAPSVQRPPERRSLVGLILDVRRGAAFQ